MKKYSNEELAELIQQGHKEYTEQLWLQVADLIVMLAGMYLDKYFPDKKDLKYDCVNESYFFFLKCIKRFDKSKGVNFNSYLSYYLKNAFRSVCFSGLGTRHENDLLNSAISLNETITDADGNEVERGDFIVDDEAVKPFNIIEEELFWKSVNKYMQGNFAKSQNERGKQIRIYMLQHRCEFMDAIRGIYPDKANDKTFVQSCRRDTKRADRDFREQYKADKDLRTKLALEDRAERHGLRQYGFASYTYSGSGVENVVIRCMEG